MCILRDIGGGTSRGKAASLIKRIACEVFGEKAGNVIKHEGDNDNVDIKAGHDKTGDE